MDSYQHIILYRRLDNCSPACDSFNIQVYDDPDCVFDAFLAHWGAYRDERQIKFFIDKSGDDLWNFVSNLRDYLSNKYTDSFLFSTGREHAQLIQLTPHRVRPIV